MDINVIKDLQNQLNELNNTVASLGGAMSKMNSATRESVNSQNNLTKDRNANTQAVDKNANGATALKNASQSADKVIQEANENFRRTVGFAKTAVLQFSATVLSSEEGVGKYGRAAESLGDAGASLGRNFGLLGTVLGGLLGIFGKVVGEVLKLDDNIINFRDGFAKSSGILPVTTGELGNLAKQARFSLDDMQKLAKTTSSLGTNLLSLGGYAGEGAVKFMKMADVSDDLRRQYGRMGISQEELLDSQAKYLQIQGVSGQSLNNQRKSVKQLQKESLEYADNLARMSSLTGKSKEELQAEREAAMMEYEEQLKISEENQRIKELRAAGRDGEADAIEKEQKNRQQLIQTYTDLYGKEMGQKAGRVMRQGGYDESTAIFKQRGEDMLGFTEKLKTANDAQGEIAKQAEKTDEAIRKSAKTYNQAGQFAGEQAMNKLVADKESLTRANNRAGMKITDALAKIKKDTDAKKQAGTDPLADSIEEMRSFERESKAKLQTFLERIDPLRNGLEMLKTAAIAVAALTGVGLAAALAPKIISGIKNLRKPKPPKDVKAKGIKSLFKKTPVKTILPPAQDIGGAGAVPPKTPSSTLDDKMKSLIGKKPKIDQADLLDKRGKPLRGAALEARTKKLSAPGLPKPKSATKLEKDDGTFAEIIDALKRAGKSSMLVIKGAGTLAVAVVELSIGLRAATDLIGMGIIKFVRGLNELDKLDGKNLIQVGLGMAGLGAGVLAMGAGAVAQSVGNIGKFFTGGKDPLTQAAEMLEKLGKMKLDRKRIEDNGMAFMAFAKAMAAISALGAASSIAGAIKGVFSSIASMMGVKLPYDEIQEFSKKNIDVKKVKINSEALAVFGKAMSSFKGSSGKQTGAAIADATSSFFKQTPPYVQMLIFSMLYVDDKNIKKNATSFKVFAEAMSSYKGYGSNAKAIGAAIADATFSFFDSKPPIEQLSYFSKLNVDARQTKKNAEAFKIFAEAMSSYEGYGSAAGVIGTAIADATIGFLKTTPPFDQMVKFSELTINSKKAKNNATAFKYFADAMSTYKGLGSPIGAIGTALAEATFKFFKVQPPLGQVVYFSNLNINAKKTKNNATGFVYFSDAMTKYKGGQSLLSAVSTIAAAGLNKLFGQDSATDAFYQFSKMDFGTKAAVNARAFLDFSKGMGILSGGAAGSSLIADLVGGAAGIVAGAVGSAVGSPGGAGGSGPGGKVVDAGKGYTTIEYTSGKVEKRTGARNWRNNNPGNIEYGSFSKKYQAIGTDGRFAVFPSYEQGRKAKEALLFEGQNYKNLSIDKAIARYAPPSENNTQNYINTVSKAAGVPPSTPLQSLNSTQRSAMLNAMEKVEGFKQGKVEVLKARKGGLFSGPSTGYPMELHGTEMVIPQMSPNSLLTKLAKTNSEVANLGAMMEAVKGQLSPGQTPSSKSAVTSKQNGITFLNREMIAALSNKFDSVIDILAESDDMQDKILKHSLV